MIRGSASERRGEIWEAIADGSDPGPGVRCGDRTLGDRRTARRLSRAGVCAMVTPAAGRWQYDVDHGGGVPNNYGYPARSECAVVVCDPRGHVTIRWGDRPANKITYGGAAEECVAGARALWDDRITDPRKIGAAREAMRQDHMAMYWGRHDDPHQLIPALFRVRVERTPVETFSICWHFSMTFYRTFF